MIGLIFSFQTYCICFSGKFLVTPCSWFSQWGKIFFWQTYVCLFLSPGTEFTSGSDGTLSWPLVPVLPLVVPIDYLSLEGQVLPLVVMKIHHWTRQGYTFVCVCRTLTVFLILPLVVGLCSFCCSAHHQERFQCPRWSRLVSLFSWRSSGTPLWLLHKKWVMLMLRLLSRVRVWSNDSLIVWFFLCVTWVSGLCSSGPWCICTSGCESCTSRSGYPGLSISISCPWLSSQGLSCRCCDGSVSMPTSWSFRSSSGASAGFWVNPVSYSISPVVGSRSSGSSGLSMWWLLAQYKVGCIYLCKLVPIISNLILGVQYFLKVVPLLLLGFTMISKKSPWSPRLYFQFWYLAIS